MTTKACPYGVAVRILPNAVVLDKSGGFLHRCSLTSRWAFCIQRRSYKKAHAPYGKGGLVYVYHISPSVRPNVSEMVFVSFRELILFVIFIMQKTKSFKKMHSNNYRFKGMKR
jgi:hypothetical protein